MDLKDFFGHTTIELGGLSHFNIYHCNFVT